MPPPFESKGKQAAWNAGQLTSYRLNELVRLANLYSSQFLFRDWHATLDALFREASTKMTPDEMKQGMQLRIRIAKSASSYNNGKKAGPQNSALFAGKYQTALDTYEMWIRNVLDSHNLMMPDAEDPGLAMEDM